MRENEFFVVDLISCKSTGEIINSLSLALETLKHSGKKIVLKLSSIHLTQSQLLSIQSLITSYGCSLDTVETSNAETAAITRNMNIITKEIDEAEINEPSFEPFNFSSNNQENKDMIVLKDVNGLHFEADLDAIQKQQESINISSDLRKAGISRDNSFEDITQQFKPDFLEFDNAKQEAKEMVEFSTPTSIDIDEPQMSDNSVEFQENNQENYNKNSIGIYKKAYSEELQDEQWEEVDFYETPTNEPIISDTKETMYINQTLRSGQILEAPGNVVIIGDCHPGSEIKAVGDITVWGVLSGIAHAGCKGNINAKVRALKLNAVQLRIGNCYSRRPDTTNIPYIVRSSIFTPEEARAVNGEIMLFKINQN